MKFMIHNLYMRENIYKYANYFETLFWRINYQLGLKWTEKEGGLLLFEILEQNLVCWDIHFWDFLSTKDNSLTIARETQKLNHTNFDKGPTLSEHNIVNMEEKSKLTIIILYVTLGSRFSYSKIIIPIMLTILLRILFQK